MHGSHNAGSYRHGVLASFSLSSIFPGKTFGHLIMYLCHGHWKVIVALSTWDILHRLTKLPRLTKVNTVLSNFRQIINTWNLIARRTKGQLALVECPTYKLEVRQSDNHIMVITDQCLSTGNAILGIKRTRAYLCFSCLFNNHPSSPTLFIMDGSSISLTSSGDQYPTILLVAIQPQSIIKH